MKRVAINGMGRIGRLTLRNLLEQKDVQVVAINDLAPVETIAHLFKYDSAQGVLNQTVIGEGNSLQIEDVKITYVQESNPKQLPWKELDIDIVLECTGVFRKESQIRQHLEAGAKKVLLSAPAKEGNIPFVVLGVNDEIISKDLEILSNASCTTNCLAPVVKVIDKHWGLSHGFITTTHGYTADQRLQDAPHRDLRRARAAAFNIIPTTTGAADAVGVVMPEMKGKLHASALRVPVITGSLIELTCVINESVNSEEVNRTFKREAMENFQGILSYNEDPIVSADIVGNPYSSIFDAPLTQVNGNLLKITSWYDNEAGYASRMADLTIRMANLME